MRTTPARTHASQLPLRHPPGGHDGRLSVPSASVAGTSHGGCRFAHEHDAVVRGERSDWLDSARERLAYLIVLDQFSRNVFRDDPKMCAHDEQARRVAVEGIDLGMARTVTGDLRAFFYLPLMHSEAFQDQERCVALFEFGRFPHRNAVLGRKGTPKELDAKAVATDPDCGSDHRGLSAQPSRLAAKAGAAAGSISSTLPAG